jgi:GrxC family glutaredoxin
MAKQVTIYSTPVCPYCRRAKSLFDELKVVYKEVDLAGDEKLRNEMVEKYQWQTVPMIFVGEEFIGGYDDVVELHAQNKFLEKVNS